MKLEIVFDINDENLILTGNNTIYIKAKDVNSFYNLLDNQNDIKKYEITFKNIDDYKNYQELLESIDNLTLNLPDIDLEGIDILNTFNYKKEPKVICRLNSIEVSLFEYTETMKTLKIIKESILKYDFSPLEQLMYLYDLLKSKIYQENNDNYEEARDLSKVLKGKDIVCLGYSNIFAGVANALGIPTYVKHYKSIKEKVSSHATVVSYIDDEVYHFKGCLEFDPTWDRRKSQEDDSWINNYNWFALSEEKSTIKKEKYGLINSDNLKEKIEKEYNNYLLLKENNFSNILLNHSLKKIINYIIEEYRLINDDETINELNLLLEDIKTNQLLNDDIVMFIISKINNLFENELTMEDFIIMLYKVRRVEHQYNPSKYPLDLDEIKIKVNSLFPESSLIQHMFHPDIDIYEELLTNIRALKDLDMNFEDKIKYDKSRMKLLNIFNKELEKKKEKELIK